ncbi:hypothetical protein OK016_02680 [Vibrio chagasii]|nr:hypothetical protein [Vibrio chagasii]
MPLQTQRRTPLPRKNALHLVYFFYALYFKIRTPLKKFLSHRCYRHLTYFKKHAGLLLPRTLCAGRYALPHANAKPQQPPCSATATLLYHIAAATYFYQQLPYLPRYASF